MHQSNKLLRKIGEVVRKRRKALVAAIQNRQRRFQQGLGFLLSRMVRWVLRVTRRFAVVGSLLAVAVWGLLSLNYAKTGETNPFDCSSSGAQFQAICDRITIFDTNTFRNALLIENEFPVMFDLLPELIGGIVFYLLAEFLFYRYRLTRRKALRNTLYRNAMPMLLLLEWLNTHFSKPLGSVPQEKWQDHYAAFIRIFLWAGQRVDRAIALNDMVSADAILKLNKPELERLHENTDAAYELSANLEYLTERLSNRDLFAHAYDKFNLEDIEKTYSSLIRDISDSELTNDLNNYYSTLANMLIALRGDKNVIKMIRSDIQKKLEDDAHRSRRTPRMPEFTSRLRFEYAK
jgi:hypothetical protein